MFTIKKNGTTNCSFIHWVSWMQYDDLIGLIETQHLQEKRDQQNFCENIDARKVPKWKKREEYALMNEWMNRIEKRKKKEERAWI